MKLSPLESAVAVLLVLQVGYWLRWRVPVFARLNLPAPAIGGLLASALISIAAVPMVGKIEFSFALQQPLMIAFFTCIGFGASVKMVRQGGAAVLLLLICATILAVLQSVIGAGVALAFGLKPLLGALIGTATLSGGPATGLAFAPQFAAAGIDGAAQIALANGMAGIVIASILAAPLSTWLVNRYRLPLPQKTAVEVEPQSRTASATTVGGILSTLTAIAVAMWIGAAVSRWIEARGITLPPYVGAMIVAGIWRNLSDWRGVAPIDMRQVETTGTVALSLFLTMAMMSLDLGLLLGIALPLLVGLAIQIAVIAGAAMIVWRLLGRDYDAAVAAGGFAGFMLGITANALAAMQSVEERFGPAPRALLAVPLVGAFLIDFVNALILTVALNL